MKKVLVTGINGFAGRYYAASLAEAGYEVHGLAKPPSPTSIPHVSRLYDVDIMDAASLRRIIASVRPDKIIHLAAIAFVAHENTEEIYLTNLVGTRNLLDAVAGSEGHSDSVMLVSSANVYGNTASGELKESSAMRPANDYALSKASMEYLKHVFPSLPLIIIRPFNYTGRGQAENFVIPKIVKHAKMRIKQLELGNLNVARDFSDVRFVADASVRLLGHSCAVGETFNICSGECHSLSDIIAMVEDLSGHIFDISVNPAFVRRNEVERLWGDPSKLLSFIGDVAAVPLRETLRWMIEE